MPQNGIHKSQHTRKETPKLEDRGPGHWSMYHQRDLRPTAEYFQQEGILGQSPWLYSTHLLPQHRRHVGVRGKQNQSTHQSMASKTVPDAVPDCNKLCCRWFWPPKEAWSVEHRKVASSPLHSHEHKFSTAKDLAQDFQSSCLSRHTEKNETGDQGESC